MKCSNHRKDLVQDCNWCGNRICRLCIERKDGIKVYCQKCTPILAGLRRVRLPPATSLPLPKTESKQEPVKKEKFVLNEDGYLVLR